MGFEIKLISMKYFRTKSCKTQINNRVHRLPLKKYSGCLLVYTTLNQICHYSSFPQYMIVHYGMSPRHLTFSPLA